MIIEKIKVLSVIGDELVDEGKTVTQYTAENEEDEKVLEQMRRDGILKTDGMPSGFADLHPDFVPDPENEKDDF